MKKHRSLREVKEHRKKIAEKLIVLAFFAVVVFFVLFKLIPFLPPRIDMGAGTDLTPTSESIVIDIDRLSTAAMADIRNFFGRPKSSSIEKRPFHEQKIKWNYDGLMFKIFAFINPIGKDTEQVYEIEITGTNYVTKTGIAVGTARDKVISILGAPRYETGGSLTYILSPSGSPVVKYYFEDNAVTKILYYDEQYFEKKEKDEVL
jgi:hypothetical protein